MLMQILCGHEASSGRIVLITISFAFQGRMKLFGTIMYPKNKYLTLQFSRGGKNVMCEDYFDNMVCPFAFPFVLLFWQLHFSSFSSSASMKVSPQLVRSVAQ